MCAILKVMNIFDLLPASKNDIHKLLTLGATIMTTISDFAAAQAAYSAQMDSAIADLSSQLTTLNAEVAKFQASPGALSAADQASLDAIQAHSASMLGKVQALDTINPPVPNPVPGQPAALLLAANSAANAYGISNSSLLANPSNAGLQSANAAAKAAFVAANVALVAGGGIAVNDPTLSGQPIPGQPGSLPALLAAANNAALAYGNANKALMASSSDAGLQAANSATQSAFMSANAALVAAGGVAVVNPVR